MSTSPESPNSATQYHGAPAPVEQAPPGVLSAFQMAKPAGRAILAVGGELKCAVCMYAGREAFLGQPVGNLTDPRAYRQYVEMIDRLKERHAFKPEVVAHDLHPQYLSTRYALGAGLPTVAVQHHHAHVASVMAEWRVDKPVVGICCDGVGYGTDGAAWGCEVLKCEGGGFVRAGHLDYFPLIGADAAAIETCRPAAALLRQAFGPEWQRHLVPSFERIPSQELETFERLMSRGLNVPRTSSLGRAFDGVSFLLGLCDRNEREAQAAIALESAAGSGPAEPYPYGTTAENGSIRMSMAPTVKAIVQDIGAGEAAGAISARFHETVARMLATTAEMVCEMGGISTVVLSGGCFANRRLLGRVTERLQRRHLQVLAPRRVSCGDAALALGQAYVAAAMCERAGGCA